MSMNKKASKYLYIETAMSALCNAILNYAAAFAIFHGRSLIPATGPDSLLRDSIGEAFLVTFLSVLFPSLIARHRRRTGALPAPVEKPTPAGNLYVRALITGLVFTCVFVACNALLLPRIFPNGVVYKDVLLFKTIFGTVIGAIATYVAVHKSLREVG